MYVFTRTYATMCSVLLLMMVMLAPISRCDTAARPRQARPSAVSRLTSSLTLCFRQNSSLHGSY